MAPSSSDERRIAAIVILLGAALFLTAVLTQRRSSPAHTIVSRPSVRSATSPRGEPMPSLNQLHGGGDDRLDYSLPLVRQLFVLDVNARTVTPAVPAPLEAWMLAHFIPVRPARTARARRSPAPPRRERNRERARRIRRRGDRSRQPYGSTLRRADRARAERI